MKNHTIIGIDPGKNGGIAVLSGEDINIYKMPQTPTDILHLLEQVAFTSSNVCYLERVHGMPGMGGQAMFTFGQGYGWLEMALLALNIPTVSITPQKWMKSLELGTKGKMTASQWKNKLKARAQQLYPSLNITLDTSDALLILHYAINNERNG